MRNVTAKLSILVFLGLLVFSTISGAFPANWKEYLIHIQKIQEIDQGTIQCRPSANLWTCQDAYGNEFTNLKITQVK
jgi:hypothetical protein